MALPARTSHARKRDRGHHERDARRQRRVARGIAALNSPTDAPISSDSAEVTVMTVCFELQKSQKTSPGKEAGVEAGLGRQGRRATRLRCRRAAGRPRA